MIKKRAFFWVLKNCLLGLCLFSGVNVCTAESGTKASSQLIEYLAAEKVNLNLSNSEMRSSLPAITVQNIDVLKAQNQKALTQTSAKIDTLNGFLDSQEKKQKLLKARLKLFRQSVSGYASEENQKASINQVKALIKLNEKSIELILENLNLANQHQKLLKDQEYALMLWSAKRTENRIIEQKKDEIKLLELKRTKLYETSLKLERQKKPSSQFLHSTGDVDQILFLNNQAILLIDYQLAVKQWEIELALADYAFLRNQEDTKALDSIIDVYTKASSAFSATKKSLEQLKESLSEARVGLLGDSASKTELLQAIEVFGATLENEELIIKETLKSKKDTLKEKRGVRQRFEDYRQASWTGVLQQLADVPIQLFRYAQQLQTKVLEHYQWEDRESVVTFWGIMLLIVVIFSGMRSFLVRVTQEKIRSRFSGHLLDGVLLLINRNLPHFLMTTLILTGLLLNQVAFVQIELVFHLLVIWLVYRLLKAIVRLVLLERAKDKPSLYERKLYRRLTGLFLLGAWATALMMIGQELPLSFLLQDVFNRLFMLFLLAISWVLWKSHDTLPELLYPWFKSKKRPFQHLIVFLAYFIPLTIFTTAVIGLFGYVQLAWKLARYEAYILFVLVLYVLIRELLTDLLDLLSEKMVSRLHNGWLWVEAIIKPLEKWLHFVLALLGFTFVLHGVSDNWELALLPTAKVIGSYPIYNGTEVHITLFSTIEAIIELLVLIWLSKWTREFCYRWLYRNIVDAAIRNSVSIFTQYAVILLGTFLFLRILGVDLTGLGIVLGGLAVGMGFGLRDFASNIVGGLMLLIERPVREGDLISLGEYEGRVAHIGIRSMRVSSWDHMDVLIPNAETFNKPVTNWTHQDGIVRSVLPIKVSRLDDPQLVRQLIHDVLDIVPEVLKDPPAQVFLKKIDEALIEFEVRYFINIQLYTRFAVRSDVLFAIMAQFKAAGIKAPIPPFRVELDKDDNSNEQDPTRK